MLLTIVGIANEKNDVAFDIYDLVAEETNNPEIQGNYDKVNKKGIKLGESKLNMLLIYR